MGLSVIPFDQFVQMNAPRQEPQMNFAAGGIVPDASGKMVVDTDPDAETDSIPAMIDGKQPAALDSGEFVIPREAVLFWGTDKLQKMIDKAREAKNGTGESALGAAK